MNNLPQISEWKRVFVDTSFIIDAVRDLSTMKKEDSKYLTINKTHKLLEHFREVDEKSDQNITWITSSIVLSELTKFENKDAVNELQMIFNSSNLEIINFTRKEAHIIVDELEKYIEQKHIETYLKELKKTLAKQDIYNPKNVISNNALIIACAKSKKCDVVLTSDKKSFFKLGSQVQLPILLTENIPLDVFEHIDHTTPIQTNKD